MTAYWWLSFQIKLNICVISTGNLLRSEEGYKEKERNIRGRCEDVRTDEK